MSLPIYITEDCDLIKLASKNDGISVVMFTADWCSPCSRMKDFINKNLYKKAQFYYVDIDKCAKLAEKYKIEGVPTFKFFVKGDKKLGDGFSGSDKNKLESSIQSLEEKVKKEEKKEKKKEKFDLSDFPK